MNERRQGDRTLGFFGVRLRVKDGLELEVSLVNHSASGARLIADRLLNLGTEVQLLVGSDSFDGVVQYCVLQAPGRYAVGLKLGS